MDDDLIEITDPNIDGSFEPTKDEIEKYAEWLGADITQDKDLFWIAEAGLKAKVPKPWKIYKQKDGSGEFYFNSETGESIWNHPLDEDFKNLFKEEKAKKLEKEKSKIHAKNTPKLDNHYSIQPLTNLKPQQEIPNSQNSSNVSSSNEKISLSSNTYSSFSSKEKENFENEIEMKNLEIASLKQQLDSANLTILALQESVSGMQIENDCKNNTLIQNELQQKNVVIQQLQEEIDRLKTLENDMNKLKIENSSLRQYRSENDSLLKENNSYQLKISNLEKQLDEMTSEEKSLQSKIIDFESTIFQKDKEIKQLKKQLLNDQNTEILELKNQVNLLQSKLEQNDEFKEDQIEKLTKSNDLLNTKYKELTSEFEEKTNVLFTMKLQNDELLKHLNKEKEKNQILTENNSKTQEKARNLSNELQILQEKISQSKGKHWFSYSSFFIFEKSPKSLSYSPFISSFNINPKIHSLNLKSSFIFSQNSNASNLSPTFDQLLLQKTINHNKAMQLEHQEELEIEKLKQRKLLKKFKNEIDKLNSNFDYNYDQVNFPSEEIYSICQYYKTIIRQQKRAYDELSAKFLEQTQLFIKTIQKSNTSIKSQSPPLYKYNKK